MTFQNKNNSAGILVRHLQRYFLTGMLCLFSATGTMFVPPRVNAQAAPERAPTAPPPEKPKGKGAKPQHAVGDASREELLKIIDKQKDLIKALEARVKELEQSAKPAEGADGQ